jgi:hypothetical protein
MEILIEHLARNLREQLALEEDIYRNIKSKIDLIDEIEYADARHLLSQTCLVLEKQFKPLNESVDKLEESSFADPSLTYHSNGSDHDILSAAAKRQGKISRILQDAYLALNGVTISNTALHTTALALDAHDIAHLALKQLQNLAPLVVQIGRLMPEVIARELHKESANIDISIAQQALKNVQLAWKKTELPN